MSDAKDAVKIFISYARVDARDVALRLRDDLRAVGYETWLDLSEIEGGSSWSREIEEAIEHCDLGLALLSQGSYVSEICRAEQLRVIRKGKRIIPLLVQPDAEPPLHLEHLNYLDFTNEGRYDEVFRDLLSDITAGRAFRVPAPRPESAAGSPFGAPPKARPRPYTTHEKRDARAFRRYLSDLREESWLGARYWWPYFLFYFADIQEVVGALRYEELLSPALRAARARRKRKYERWDNTVRLYFRPRTPDLFLSEGFRPLEKQRPNQYLPMPVYLLFDLEAVICQSETRFTDGDAAETKKTFKTAGGFRDLPFDMIYHDSWFTADEREEVMRHRRAQVIVPDKLGLESLQYIWCRSQAEYETLRELLPPEVWRKWRAKVTTRTDYALFNRRWLYVDEAALESGQARFRFNRCDSLSDYGPFTLRIEATLEDRTITHQQEDFIANADLILELPAAEQYSLRLYLNDDLAYAGRCSTNDGLL